MLNNFDDINMRSIGIDEFFGPMEISNEQKEKRISLAEDLLDEILFVLSLVSVLNDYAEVDWSNIQKQFENSFKSAMAKQKQEEDDWVHDYIIEISEKIALSTMKGMEDQYYVSYDRARLIAENEANAIYAHYDDKQAKELGCLEKTWMTMEDKRVRHTHARLDNQTIGIDELFSVGGSYMAYPMDRAYGASPREIINCRCSVHYS